MSACDNPHFVNETSLECGAESAANANPAGVLPWLPCVVSVEIPLQRFTIGMLARLNLGAVVSTASARNTDVPISVNGLLVGWSELEVIDNRLAVRITEIA